MAHFTFFCFDFIQIHTRYASPFIGCHWDIELRMGLIFQVITPDK